MNDTIQKSRFCLLKGSFYLEILSLHVFCTRCYIYVLWLAITLHFYCTGYYTNCSVLPTFGGVKLQRSNIRAKNPILRGSRGLLPRGNFLLWSSKLSIWEQISVFSMTFTEVSWRKGENRIKYGGLTVYSP